MWAYHLLEKKFSFFTPNKAKLIDLYSRTKLTGGNIPLQMKTQKLLLEK